MEKVKIRPKCNTCGKDFYSNSALKHHAERKHENESVTRNFECELCGKKFLVYVDLQSHISKVHEKSTEARNFKCEKCDKSFKTGTALRLHVGAIHDKIKNNKCGICSRSFFTKKYLLKHVRVLHEKAEVTSCKQCGKTYTSKTSLKAHYKRSHSKGEVISIINEENTESQTGLKTETSSFDNKLEHNRIEYSTKEISPSSNQSARSCHGHKIFDVTSCKSFQKWLEFNSNRIFKFCEFRRLL